MAHELRMLVVIGADHRGVESAVLASFRTRVDLDIIKNIVRRMEEVEGMTSFAFVFGSEITTEKFVSADEAIGFVDLELTKHVAG